MIKSGPTTNHQNIAQINELNCKESLKLINLDIPYAHTEYYHTLKKEIIEEQQIQEILAQDDNPYDLDVLNDI